MIVSKPLNYNVSNWQNCPKVIAPEVMSPKTRVLSPDFFPRVVGCNRACRWPELGDRMGQLVFAIYQSILPNLEGYLCQNWSSFYSTFHLRQNWCVTRLTQLWEQICGLGSIPDSKLFVDWLINSSSPGVFFFPRVLRFAPFTKTTTLHLDIFTLSEGIAWRHGGHVGEVNKEKAAMLEE